MLVCALFVSVTAYPQPVALPPAILDGAARATVVHAAEKALRDGYVYPDVGERTAKAIEAALAAGNYDKLSDPKAFAQRLTDDLMVVAHDKHLAVNVSIPEKARPARPEAAGLPHNEGGVLRADRLAGNIGYIEIATFPPLDLFRHPFDRAMATLAKTKALIIDARRGPGGTIDAIAYLASYLVRKGAKPVFIDRWVFRNAGSDTFHTDSFPTSATPFSYAGKPVYVLTSSRTFSGGEELAYDLQALHLCTVIGERTAGGAHTPVVQSLGEGFEIAVPYGRAENPITGTNWEGIGVKPDIEVPAADALRLALEHLGRKPTSADIDGLSEERVFTPRTTRQPGSEDAVRRLIEGLQRGEPRYDQLSDYTAQLARERLSYLHDLYTKLGAIQTVSFVQESWVGEDIYDVDFANGSVRLYVTLWPDGKMALGQAIVTEPPK